MSKATVSTVKAADSEIPYAKFGSGEKIFVLLPGLYTKSLMPLADAVASQCQRFLEEYTVYFFDRVLSPLEGYTVQDMAADTIRAMDALSLRNCYVLGVSAGGIVAQIIAAERPDLVKKLAVSSTSARETSVSKKVFAEWTALAKSLNLSALNESFAKNVYTDTFYQKYKEEILSSLAGATDEDLARFAIFSSALLGFDIREKSQSISCPLLALGAGKDKVFGSDATLDIAEKNHGRAFIFKDYGHAVYDEAPDFLDKVAGFFAEPVCLHVNACVRPTSRTNKLAQVVLEKEQGSYIQEVNLQKEQIMPLDWQSLRHRDECMAQGHLGDKCFSYGWQFARADRIVISAPYWDLLFPASLRAYFERVCLVGVTFAYTESGIPKSLCQAKKLTYVTTAGGFVGERHLGFDYVKALAELFFGIEDVSLIKAEGLDIAGADVQAIMEKAYGRR